MDTDNASAEAQYFGLAETWDEELYGKLKRDRLIAFAVAGVAALIAILSIIAVMLLTPLKSVEPYMVMVDKTTGHSEMVQKLVYRENSPLTEQESFVLAEINNYVIARHTYDPIDARRRYLRLQMSTSAAEMRRYAREYSRDVKRLPSNSRRTVNVKSIVPNMSKKTATVRFSTTLDTQETTLTKHWIATVQYDFVSLDMEAKYRYLNPLGFIMKSYRVDPEALQ